MFHNQVIPSESLSHTKKVPHILIKFENIIYGTNSTKKECHYAIYLTY